MNNLARGFLRLACASIVSVAVANCNEADPEPVRPPFDAMASDADVPDAATDTDGNVGLPPLQRACEDACRVSVQVPCPLTPTSAACVRDCIEGGSECIEESTRLLRCLADLLPSDLQCHPLFKSPTLKEGRCAEQSTAVATCQVNLL